MVAALALAAVAATAAPPEPLPGTLRFEDVAGAKVTLDEPGVLYLVDFWVVGCKGCIEEMPELERLARELEPTGRFKLISVHWGDWRGAKLKEFMTRNEIEISHPVHSDPEGWLERLGKVAFPTKLLVRDGKILERRVGGGAGAYRLWKPLIAAALK